jgi:ribulose kinase
MEHWVDAADWIVWQLTGGYLRNACTAGYKSLYARYQNVYGQRSEVVS